MTGICKYCGQIVDIGEDITGSPNEEASKLCDCYKAAKERQTAKKIADAQEKATEIFGEDAAKYGFETSYDERTIDFINGLIEKVGRREVLAASISITGGCRCTIKCGSKGQIKVQRSDSKSYELEGE